VSWPGGILSLLAVLIHPALIVIIIAASLAVITTLIYALIGSRSVQRTNTGHAES